MTRRRWSSVSIMLALLAIPPTAQAEQIVIPTKLAMDGIIAFRSDQRQATFYYPEHTEWPRPDVLVNPVLAATDSGQRTTTLGFVLMGVPADVEQTLKLTIDGKPEALALQTQNAVDREFGGCREATTVKVPVDPSVIQRIAQAQKVVVSFTKSHFKKAYVLSDQDLKGFKQVADLFAMKDLPPATKWFDEDWKGGPQGQDFKDIKNPRPIQASRVQPKYPEVARRHRIEGKVILLATILKDGSLGDLKVIRAAGGYCGFEEAALAAVKHWRYQPATRNGEPIEVYFTIFVEYHLLPP